MKGLIKYFAWPVIKIRLNIDNYAAAMMSCLQKNTHCMRKCKLGRLIGYQNVSVIQLSYFRRFGLPCFPTNVSLNYAKRIKHYLGRNPLDAFWNRYYICFSRIQFKFNQTFMYWNNLSAKFKIAFQIVRLKPNFDNHLEQNF